MDDVFAVIMAGGVGARFWPLSRRATPKQLLPLGPTEEPLLAATIRRSSAIAPPERTFVVTNASLVDATRAAAPAVPKENILAEPVGRNTAPCVAWAAAHVRRRMPQGVMAVLPADHHIGNEEAYGVVMRTAVDAARGGSLVTVGLHPTRPETGYGYIEVGPEVQPGVHRVARFVEKPDAARAKAFLSAGKFLWNSGMFFFRADVILDEIGQHLPELADGIAELDRAAARGTEDAELAGIYPRLPPVSLDYGVMEKARSVLVVPGQFDWSDLGSWTTAWDLASRDTDGNAVPKETICIDANGNYVRTAQGKVVALIGVRDLIVVDTPDALLVMPRERSQDVKRVVETLEKRGKGPL